MEDNKTVVETTTVKTDKPAESTAAQQNSAVDEMEKATKQSLDSMKEAGNEKNTKLIDESEDKLDEMYTQFRKWLSENTNPEKIKEETAKLKEETARVLNETREKAIEFSKNPEFQKTMEAGKEFLSGTGAMISEGFQKGYDRLMEVPEIKKVSEKVDEGVDKLRQNKYLKQGADFLQKELASFSESLGSFFTPSDQDEKK